MSLLIRRDSEIQRIAIGIDQAQTKTSLAITDLRQNVLYADNCSHYVQRFNHEDRHRRVIYQLLRGLDEFKVQLSNVFIASNGYLTREFLAIFENLNFRTESVEIFNDVHSHYGLTSMPGQCFMLVSGTYWGLTF